MGTPDFAVPSLRALVEDPRCDVTLVVSQPDRVAGRGRKVTPTPVKAAAVEAGIPTFQPESLRTDEAHARLDAENADLFVVAAYGQILRQNVLDLPTHGCINVHASLLPRWRGAAPIHRAIEAGDAVTGVSIMRMERGLDTGPVYRMEAVMIGDTETAGELHDRLAALGARTLRDALDDIVDAEFVPSVQPSARTTYARMLGRDDRKVDFDAPALEVVARINGMSPWPGVSVVCGDESLTLLRAEVAAESIADAAPGTVICASPRDGLRIACADGIISILDIKRPGKRAMPVTDCLCGVSLPAGAEVSAP